MRINLESLRDLENEIVKVDVIKFQKMILLTTRVIQMDTQWEQLKD